jgi:hypothetical protein
MSDAAEALSVAGDDGSGEGSILARVGSFLGDHWKLVGAAVLVGAVVLDRHLAYRRGYREGLSAGGYDPDDEADETED